MLKLSPRIVSRQSPGAEHRLSGFLADDFAPLWAEAAVEFRPQRQERVIGPTRDVFSKPFFPS
ncbi:hypothetical protein [Microvirga lotononidis]|uniref:hypothetical protein n=1 Tax=Microvirga lotononidis TaxID=864069 RepID=UPI0002E7488F|nr:hypothetical protein [Microvirga lotononidis]WQO31497.1 hypothetical protein U0023_35045 [Microvirga lotononidis]